MTTTAVEVADYEIRPHSLKVTVRFPAFEYVQVTRYRRRDCNPTIRPGKFAWYCNDTQGSLPDQHLLADVLNGLVLTHPILSRVAAEYEVS